jgi:hypothetical protein
MSHAARCTAQVKLESAVVGLTVGPTIQGVIADAGFYADHHVDMLKHCNATSNAWAPLTEVLDSADAGMAQASKASGAAAAHSHAARYEAARKLIMNRAAVINDVTYQNPLTQKHLRRASPEDAAFVEEALREVTRRLLGKFAGMRTLEEVMLDESNARQVAAWATATQYLVSRIQSAQEEMPTRTPDMSATAAAAMKAVLAVVGKSASRGGATGVRSLFGMRRK